TPAIEGLSEGGTGLGGRCYYAEQCASGLCVTASDDSRIAYCSKVCASEREWLSRMACPHQPSDAPAVCRYRLPTPGALGSSCSGSPGCEEATCVGAAGGSTGVCSRVCDPDHPQCPAGFACARHALGPAYCLAQAGCSLMPYA